MEHFYMHISSLLLLLMTCYAAIGDSKAELNVDIARTILPGQPTNGSCIASGKMYSNVPRYFYIRASLVHSNNNKENCIIEHIGRLQNLSHAHYQQNFSITCNNGNSSVGIQCFTSENDDTSQILSVQVIKPKLNKNSSNTATNVGLPVTMRCYVEGDPNHYWTGLLNRHTIVQAEDEISTTPNFGFCNGTTRYLTIHSIKVPGKYECKVYTVTEEVQDQVSHQVYVTEESREQITIPSSSITSSLFNNNC